MINPTAVVVTAVLLLTVAVAQPGYAQAQLKQEYSCPCKMHNAGARGSTPCSIAEKRSYCEIIYGLPPLISPGDKKVVAMRFAKLSKQLDLSVPLRFSLEDDAIVRNVPPGIWAQLPEREKARLASHLLTISVFPLISRGESESLILKVGKTLLTNMPKILESVGKRAPTTITKGLVAGAGCVLAEIADVRIMFNSGWNVRKFKDKWSCAWAAKR